MIKLENASFSVSSWLPFLTPFSTGL